MTRLPARGRTGAKLKENEFADCLRSVRFYFIQILTDAFAANDAGCRTHAGTERRRKITQESRRTYGAIKPDAVYDI